MELVVPGSKITTVGAKLPIFRFSDPLGTDPKNTATTGVKPPIIVGPTQKMKRILVIEDDEDIRDMLQMTLSQQGHIVITANNGKEGVEAYKVGEIGLVLCDLMMPVLSGKDTVKQIRIKDPSAIIIIASAVATVDSEELFSLGVKEIITKPIDRTELLRIIDSY